MTRREWIALMPLLARAAEAPPELLTWLRAQALPLKTVEPGDPRAADLTPLDAVVVAASIVVLGEVTHGTHEIFRLKHRLIEHLVTRLGFTHVGLEASVTDAARLNEYVLTGQGDPAALLHGLGFWAWDTVELLEFVRWLRGHNTKAAKSVRFIGFDIQHPESALAALRAALGSDGASFDPAAVTDWPAFLRRLPDNAALMDSARQVHQNLQAKNKEVSRDRSMAANVQWLMDHNPPAKLVLWTHNGHTSLTNIRGFDPMGVYLRQIYGDKVLLIGSAFYEGSFQTMTPGGMRRFTVAPSPAGTLDATFAAVGPPVFLVDFRRAPRTGPVADWLHGPQQIRSAGGTYSENAPLNTLTPAEAFDAMLFVRTSTPAQPLPPP